MNEMPTNQPKIDPDPFTIISTMLAGVSVAIQLIEVYRRNSDVTKPSNVNRSVLLHMEESIENFERRFDAITRTIERGSEFPEKNSLMRNLV